MNGLPCGWLITSVDGTPMKEPPHPVLAQGKVRYVGDGVALVVADSLHQAKDAAELIDVDYEVLPAVVNLRRRTEARRAAASRRARPATSAIPGRWATRRRPTRRSRRRRT